MEIKAIQTYYNGHHFRSRLEARWAVFFDAAGIEWEYEPEGFVLPSGRHYLPDFLIHNCTERDCGDLWVEVKGTMNKTDESKITEFICPNGREIENSLIVLGNIPNGATAFELWQNMCQSGYKPIGESDIYPFNFMHADGDYFSFGLMANGNGGLALCGDASSYYNGIDEELTVHAYNMARQARFEHGEKPCL